MDECLFHFYIFLLLQSYAPLVKATSVMACKCTHIFHTANICGVFCRNVRNIKG